MTEYYKYNTDAITLLSLLIKLKGKEIKDINQLKVNYLIKDKEDIFNKINSYKEKKLTEETDVMELLDKNSLLYLSTLIGFALSDNFRDYLNKKVDYKNTGFYNYTRTLLKKLNNITLDYVSIYSRHAENIFYWKLDKLNISMLDCLGITTNNKGIFNQKFKNNFDFFNFLSIGTKPTIIYFKFKNNNKYYVMNLKDCYLLSCDKENLNELIKYYLVNIINKQPICNFTNRRVLDNLRLLWSIQSKKDKNIKYERNKTNELKEINSNLFKLFKDILNNVDYDNDILKDLTFKELVNFYYEFVVEHKLTIKTRNVQDWLLINSPKYISFNNDDKIYGLAQHVNFDLLNNNFHKLNSNSKEFIKVKQKLFQDKYIRKDVKLKKVYKLDNQFNQDKKSGKYKIECIHGTKNMSVISILLNGFLDAEQLDKRHINHSYTASGLGKGIYFARLSQASKSINYSNKYLFICDVVYNTAKTVMSYNSNLKTNKDIVIGSKVGANNIDEIVAKSPRNIYMKYLIEIEK